jgi:hypothetical protein
MASLKEKHGAIELESIVISDQAAAAEGHPFIDPLAEKKLLWKVDLHVVPILFLLFLMAFLDRTNIGLLTSPSCLEMSLTLDI